MEGGYQAISQAPMGVAASSSQTLADILDVRPDRVRRASLQKPSEGRGSMSRAKLLRKGAYDWDAKDA